MKGLKRRLKRLEAARRPDHEPAPDMSGFFAHLDAVFDAYEHGRLYSVVPHRGPPPEPESDPTAPGARFIDSMRQLRERLDADPDVKAEQAECERRRAAVVRAIEREQAARP